MDFMSNSSVEKLKSFPFRSDIQVDDWLDHSLADLNISNIDGDKI